MNRIGAEAGVEWKDTSFTAQVVNSLNTVARDGEVVAVGTTPSLGRHADLVLFANQILGERSGVNVLWAHGFTRPPIDEAAFAAGTSDATWNNAYDRLAIFGSLGVGWFTGVAGGGLGFDQSRDPSTGAKKRFRSGGGYVEGDFSVSALVTPFLRLDQFDPSAAVGSNAQYAATVGCVLHREWVYATPEFQYKITRRPEESDRRDGVLVLRVAAIY
jgi:hypothetical protein